MNYEPEEFLRLMAAVEEQGGEHLDEKCSFRKYEFTGEHHKPMTIEGCGNESIFEISYVDSRSVEPVEKRVKVCAVHDNVGMWPRFKGALA